MVWCKHCAEDHPTIRDHDNGYVCCTGCGRVIEHDNYVNDCTFIKTAGGQSQLSGRFVRSVLSDYSASHERTLLKGRDEISDMVVSLCVSGGDSIINEAHAFYTIAVERNFTRGRRTALVAASCLYIACRQNEKPYLLIDFSEYLQINVYVLGAVFLQLCKLLRLEEHPIVQKLVDPSLFIHRFTEQSMQLTLLRREMARDDDELSHVPKWTLTVVIVSACVVHKSGLLGEKNLRVSSTALKIIASMKRDWMQTGRKPSGLCGAALYISALSHGLKYSKSNVVSIVHVCETTLTKRLIEFENTESGSLTIDELMTKSDELEQELHSQQEPSKASGITEVLCQHKSSGVAHFAHGLCRTCYDEFVEISGGLGGGSEPPAFQRAERQRMSKAASGDDAEEQSVDPMSSLKHHEQNEIQADSSKPGLFVSEEEQDISSKAEVTGNTGHPDNEVDSDQLQERQENGGMGINETESFSDIDDAEVDEYLHNEEEKPLKKLIWEMMNKDYLEELAAKEAAAAEAREAYAAKFANCSEDVLAAQELAAAAAANVAKSRKEKKQRRTDEAKNTKPAQTAVEAARNVLTKKRLSSKINFDVLDKLFDGPKDEENTKKQRVEFDLGNAVGQEKHKQGEPDTVENDGYGQESGYGEDYDAEGEYGEYSYEYGNQEGYGYDQGYGLDY